MSVTHRIRLRAAWEVTADGTAWMRSFGRPTGVGVGDRLWLVIERPAACKALLNGRPLPPVPAGAKAWRHDVTADLRERNELRLQFVVPAGRVGDGGRVPLPESLGEVLVEIEAGG